MRQRLLFEGELSDVTLENVFPTLISKAVETGDWGADTNFTN